MATVKVVVGAVVVVVVVLVMSSIVNGSTGGGDDPSRHADMTCHVMSLDTGERYRAPMATSTIGSTIGPLMRDWRTRRGRSQLDLSLDVGVSTRHLSYVETGKSRPSPELVLAVAEHLEVPLRERNTMLLAAGFAPRYSDRGLDAPAMRPIVAALQRMLDAHDPYPGVVIDRQWNVVLANEAVTALTAGLPPEVLEPPVNVFRMCLHPAGLAERTVNFAEWADYLLRQLRRTIVLTGDAGLAAIEQEVLAFPNVARLPRRHAQTGDSEPALLIPFELRVDEERTLSFFTTLTTFGTPLDVTLDELSVELFFPADDVTDRAVRAG
jgi:transcriptional regulator with XRE-family HTH domain